MLDLQKNKSKEIISTFILNEKLKKNLEGQTLSTLAPSPLTRGS